jgi:predicted porin
MTYKTPAGDCEATQAGIAIAIPIGQGAIRGSYSQAEEIDGNYNGAGTCGAVGTSDNGAKQYNIGYDYRFSKRTTVGVGYAKIDNDDFAAFTWSGLSSANTGNAVTPPAGSDVEIFFVSIIHRF